MDDLTVMDDVTFLAEKARLREAITTAPPEGLPPETQERLDAINDEFLRRAGLAWRDATCA
jgi:hypothetical protein